MINEWNLAIIQLKMLRAEFDRLLARVETLERRKGTAPPAPVIDYSAEKTKRALTAGTGRDP